MEQNSRAKAPTRQEQISSFLGAFAPWRDLPCLAALSFAVLLVAVAYAPLFAQKRSAVTTIRSTKLPAPEKIVADYLKAVGGRRRIMSIRDATYEWAIQLNGQPLGNAKTQVKAPASARMDMIFGNGEISSAANRSSAWERGLDGTGRTLTGPEAGTARLQAALNAGRLVNYKTLNVLAHTTSLGKADSEPAYVVEFSSRSGARLRYWFGASSKLLLQVEDETRKTTSHFGDYRAEGGLLEPHRVEMEINGTGPLTFVLQRVSYNGGLGDSVFDPPRSAEALDIRALLREVGHHQDEIDRRRSEYTYTEKRTRREVDGHGQVKKETVQLYEVFPMPGRRHVFKLISENGVPLSPERAAKEEKRVAEELSKAEREHEKDKQKQERERAERAKKRGDEKTADEEDEGPGVATFLRACEFVSPRRERLRDRDTVVFDFRPRADFHPRNRTESLIAKLVGVVWIDPTDKQVVRLEARLAEAFKVGGGLLASVRPGAAVVLEQTRMAEGVWLPRFSQINASFKLLLLASNELNVTTEFGDYRRFTSHVRDYKLDAPKTGTPPLSKPEP